MNQILAKLIVIASATLFAASANAIAVNEYFIETGTGEFTVTNDSDQDIYLFAVGSHDATYADYRPALDGTNLGWDGLVLNEEAWNNGYSIYLGRDIYVNTAHLGGGFGEPGELGSFGNLFAGYKSVIVFFVNVDQEGRAPIAASTTASGFTFFAGELASPFIAYGDGGIIAMGDTLHGVPGVPVPAAVWLFGSGLIGLVGVARRKQS